MTAFGMETSSPHFETPLARHDMVLERVAADVEAYIRTRFSVPPDDAVFTRSVDLFEEGYVDSTGLVELIAHVEQLYSVRLPEEALFDPSFSHIDGIAHVVADLLAP
jgi:acyl carrier protein